MQEIMEQILPNLINIAGILLTALAGWLGLQARLWLNTKQKRAIVESSVKYAEQIGKALDSDKKFELAKERALAMLAEVGIKISEVELETLIEAAVNTFFEHYDLPGAEVTN